MGSVATFVAHAKERSVHVLQRYYSVDNFLLLPTLRPIGTPVAQSNPTPCEPRPHSSVIFSQIMVNQILIDCSDEPTKRRVRSEKDETLNLAAQRANAGGGQGVVILARRG